MSWRPKYLSVSSVALYVRCPLQFKTRYVERLVTPSNPPMLFGKTFHAALEAEHRGQDSEATLIAEYNRQQATLDAAGLGQMPSKMHALKLLDMYRDLGLGGRLGEPERKFVRRLPMANIPVPVLGYMDLPIPERRRLREFKTTSTASWTLTKIMLEHQLHVYGWAYQGEYHHRPECVEYVIFGTQNPTVEVIEAASSPDGLRLFEIAAEGTWRGILAGNFDGCGECDVCSPPSETPAANGSPSFVWED